MLELNARAVEVIRRVESKLTGRDFSSHGDAPLTISKQVDLLIQQAASDENLCQAFIGWCVRAPGHHRPREPLPPPPLLTHIVSFSVSCPRCPFW